MKAEPTGGAESGASPAVEPAPTGGAEPGASRSVSGGLRQREAGAGQTPGADRATLENERRILERLQGVEGCAPAAGRAGSLPDSGAEALEHSGLPGRLDLPRFLALAARLARILAAVHGRGVIHNDIGPSTVRVGLADGAAELAGFGLATTAAEEHPLFDPLSRLQGSLAYLSPEKTGRMNRAVDARSDLYSLGATLYLLATGEPPFPETDALGLVHAHLARLPPSPRRRAPWLPAAVEQVILKLLAKEPDDRYQSAAGLAYDLERLGEAQRLGEPLEAVALGERDLPAAPRPPRRLYGRERELTALMEAFERVRHGGSESLFVRGPAGVGKTSLVNEVHRPVTLRRGFFVSDKFEQYLREKASAAPASRALRRLCEMLLAEPEEEVLRWRARILATLGPEAGALLEVLPELAALLGPQPRCAELGPVESERRLYGLLLALVRAVAAPEHPLVLFLDDLHWADAPSLKFVEALLEDERIEGLLLLGAWRDGEVDEYHPLARMLRRRAQAGAAPPELRLGNLTLEELEALLSDMLRVPVQQARPLALALAAQTGGNPYFTRELLGVLHAEGVLRPDPPACCWRFDPEAVAAHPVSANVVDFLTAQLGDLPSPTAEALVAAACLGNACTLDRLALATGLTPAALPDLLAPALERGILVTTSALALQRAEPGVSLRFCHDRMQQAVYQLRDAAWRRRLHLGLARCLAVAGEPLSAAEHYAAAAPLALQAEERAAVLDLFLEAARQSRQVAAFLTAERFINLGLELLGTAQDRDTRRDFALQAELHLVLYCQSRHEEADRVYAWLQAHATVPLLLVEPACTQVMSLSNRTRYDDALRLASALLQRLGTEVPLDDTPAALQEELEVFYRRLEPQAAAGQLDRAAADDAVASGAAKLMNRVIPAAFFCRPLVACWLSVRGARQWLEEGYRASYIYPMSCTILATIPFRQDYATGYRAARAAWEAGLAREQGTETARVEHVLGLFNSHWFEPLERGLAHARSAFEALERRGELEFACYTFFTSQAALLDTAPELSQFEAEVQAALGFALKTGNRHGEQAYLAFRQLLRCLRGLTLAPGSFAEESFEESAHAAAVRGNPMASCYFHLYRALAACLFDDAKALAVHAEAAVALTPYITGFYPTALANVLHSLALAGRLREGGSEERGRSLQRLEENQRWLQRRAADAPMNFRHLYYLVEAERLDGLGRVEEAYVAFEQALHEAQVNQRPWHLALATERAGRCYLRRGLEHPGRALLSRALDLYARWGAAGKVRAMGEGALVPEVSLARPGTEGLDLEGLLRAAEAIASERSLSRLVARVAEVVGGLTGATDVRVLVREDTEGWALAGGLRGEQSLEPMALERAVSQGVVSARVFRLALRSGAPVLSEDAVMDARFVADPHFRSLTVCSLLALPLAVRGRVRALLTLENRLYRAAFDVVRVRTAITLCGQLAVAIENAVLNRSLEQRIAEREAALREVYERLTQAEVERSRLAERERLLQDVHDGFGSHLATARLRVEHGELGREELARLLGECLEDLHLLVDTLGQEEGSLLGALANYRYRCQNRLAGSPVEMAWRLELNDCPPLEERRVLHVLRVLQEALSNALRHAGARRIEVSARQEPPGWLVLEVRDDGRGMSPGAAPGRGLRGMQKRARELGGSIEWTALSPGTRVSLRLPLSPAGATSAPAGVTSAPASATSALAAVTSAPVVGTDSTPAENLR